MSNSKTEKAGIAPSAILQASIAVDESVQMPETETTQPHPSVDELLRQLEQEEADKAAAASSVSAENTDDKIASTTGAAEQGEVIKGLEKARRLAVAKLEAIQNALSGTQKQLAAIDAAIAEINGPKPLTIADLMKMS